MRYLYTVVLYLLSPFFILRLYWKSRRLLVYRERILERFFLGNQRVRQSVDIWLHAVSLGEVVAATPLIDALLAKKWRVLVTTMTPTGSQQVIKRFGSQVFHQYVPYDFPWVLRRFFRAIKPRLGIIMETELWPNVINQSKRINMPLLLINARLSDRSFKRYENVRFMFKPILNQFTAIFAQSDEDARRFIKLGASASIVQVMGNIKFDVQLQLSANKECETLKTQWGDERVVVIAASTHQDEETQILSRLNMLKISIPNVLLLIVPRHPERFEEVFQLSVSQGFKTGRRSEIDTIDATAEVIIVDSMGELLGFYQISDYAFVGGSLVPVGGHNVLEPIAARVPVFSGPYMNNSKAICHDLCAAGAMVMVDSVDELMASISSMHTNSAKRQQQITNATRVLVANKGTVVNCMKKIESIME